MPNRALLLELNPTNEDLIVALGLPLEDLPKLRAIRLWHGDATVQFALEQVDLVSQGEKGTVFFRAINNVQEGRKAAGTWPRTKFARWYGGEPLDAGPSRPAPSCDSTAAERVVAAQMAIKWTFKNPSLLTRALTHASAGPDHNEPLACIGDRLYNAWAAKRVFTAEPFAPKGVMTDRIIDLCRGDTQAVAFFDLALHEVLVVIGTRLITSAMASTALEAVVGALYLDGGTEAADAFLDRAVATARGGKP